MEDGELKKIKKTRKKKNGKGYKIVLGSTGYLFDVRGNDPESEKYARGATLYHVHIAAF